MLRIESRDLSVVGKTLGPIDVPLLVQIPLCLISRDNRRGQAYNLYLDKRQ
jgi:hypothetical protein